MAAGRVALRRERVRGQILLAAWDAASEHGLDGMTLAAIATRVGMRPPSLYEYFDSKGAILDAMFEDGYRQMQAEVVAPILDQLPDDPSRDWLIAGARRSLEFMTADLFRYQLMFTRAVPGWEPSPEAYAASIEVYESLQWGMQQVGIDDQGDLDLFTAVTAGLAAQQFANDPGGDRYLRLVDRAVDAVLHVMRSTT